MAPSSGLEDAAVVDSGRPLLRAVRLWQEDAHANVAYSCSCTHKGGGPESIQKAVTPRTSSALTLVLAVSMLTQREMSTNICNCNRFGIVPNKNQLSFLGESNSRHDSFTQRLSRRSPRSSPAHSRRAHRGRKASDEASTYLCWLLYNRNTDVCADVVQCLAVELAQLHEAVGGPWQGNASTPEGSLAQETRQLKAEMAEKYHHGTAVAMTHVRAETTATPT